MDKNLDIYICDCNSLEHQLIFWYNEEDNMYFVHTNLVNYRNFWKRLWFGLKYAFGYKSRYGSFDEFILNQDDVDRLKLFLSKNTNESNGAIETI